MLATLAGEGDGECREAGMPVGTEGSEVLWSIVVQVSSVGQIRKGNIAA